MNKEQDGKEEAKEILVTMRACDSTCTFTTSEIHCVFVCSVCELIFMQPIDSAYIFAPSLLLRLFMPVWVKICITTGQGHGLCMLTTACSPKGDVLLLFCSFDHLIHALVFFAIESVIRRCFFDKADEFKSNHPVS